MIDQLHPARAVYISDTEFQDLAQYRDPFEKYAEWLWIRVKYWKFKSFDIHSFNFIQMVMVLLFVSQG